VFLELGPRLSSEVSRSRQRNLTLYRPCERIGLLPVLDQSGIAYLGVVGQFTKEEYLIDKIKTALVEIEHMCYYSA